jgi:hypothetical protein
MNTISPIIKIFLFDEYGTPTFESGRESDVFIGVSCLYNKSDEKNIFESVNSIIGLNNERTKKSTELSANGSISFARAISKHNIDLTVAYLDLKDPDLEAITNDYSRIGNKVRLQTRAQYEPNIRERKISHIIHSNILATSMFEPVANLLRNTTFPLYLIEPYIDELAIPKCDLQHYLILRAKSIEEQIRIMIDNLGLFGSVTIKNIEMLKNKDNPLNLKRKRIIDCITGIISKNFNQIQNKTHTSEPMQILQENFSEQFIFIKGNENMKMFMRSMIEDIKKRLL